MPTTIAAPTAMNTATSIQFRYQEIHRRTPAWSSHRTRNICQADLAPRVSRKPVEAVQAWSQNLCRPPSTCIPQGCRCRNEAAPHPQPLAIRDKPAAERPPLDEATNSLRSRTLLRCSVSGAQRRPRGPCRSVPRSPTSRLPQLVIVLIIALVILLRPQASCPRWAEGVRPSSVAEHRSATSRDPLADQRRRESPTQ